MRHGPCSVLSARDLSIVLPFDGFGFCVCFAETELSLEFLEEMYSFCLRASSACCDSFSR